MPQSSGWIQGECVGVDVVQALAQFGGGDQAEGQGVADGCGGDSTCGGYCAGELHACCSVPFSDPVE